MAETVRGTEDLATGKKVVGAEVPEVEEVGAAPGAKGVVMAPGAEEKGMTTSMVGRSLEIKTRAVVEMIGALSVARLAIFSGTVPMVGRNVSTVDSKGM